MSNDQILTRRQKGFVDAYASLSSPSRGNATQSAIASGYSERSARTQGCRLLMDDNIKAAIETRNLEQGQRARIGEDELMTHILWGIKFSKDKGNLSSHVRYLDLLSKIMGLQRQETTPSTVAPTIIVTMAQIEEKHAPRLHGMADAMQSETIAS